MPTNQDPFRGQALETVLRINDARTIDIDRYISAGNFDRFGYLRDLSDQHGIPIYELIFLADVLGPDEDFDGLLATIEDAIDVCSTLSDDAARGA